MNTVVLQTRRLRFRRMVPGMVPGDENLILEMLSDDQAKRFFHRLATPDGARRWVNRNVERYAEHGFGLWMIVLRETAEVVGDCGLTFQEVDGQKELEVGYHLIARYRGNGYATEAATACVQYGFRETNVERICSLVHPQNTASERVAARVHRCRRECVRDGSTYWMFFTRRTASLA